MECKFTVINKAEVYREKYYDLLILTEIYFQLNYDKQFEEKRGGAENQKKKGIVIKLFKLK